MTNQYLSLRHGCGYLLETDKSETEPHCCEPGEKVFTSAVERRSHRIVTRNVQAPTSDGDVGEIKSMLITLFGGSALGSFHLFSGCPCMM